MFEIRQADAETIALEGRLDASHEEVTAAFLETVQKSMTVDFAKLDYIGSNGLGLLFAAHKRLCDQGDGLRLVNLNPHIREVFRLCGFDTIFTID